MRLFANSSIAITEPTYKIIFRNETVQVSVELYTTWVSEHWVVPKKFHVYIKNMKTEIQCIWD